MTIASDNIEMSVNSNSTSPYNSSKKRNADWTAEELSQDNARKASKTEDGTGKRVSYQSFQRTVEQLSLDTIPSSESSGITLETNSANGSIFYSKLQHWDEMNLSQGFVEFKKAVKTFSNLPLVIFNRRQIFEELKWHVSKYDPLYLEPLYDLLTGLAQDVQYEFVKFYPEYIELIADSTKNTKSNALAIKAAFDSLNQVIKIMQRAFLNQIESSEIPKDGSSIVDNSSDTATKGTVALMKSTVNFFKLGISPKTYKLCGSAISQIIRKASGSKREHCLEILFEATENADDSNSLLEMTGIILAQSVKSTSKSLVVNADKIWTQILNKIDSLKWEGSALSRLLHFTITNLSATLLTKDIQRMLGKVFQIWDEINAKQPLTNENHYAKLESVKLMLSIGRSKKIDFEDESSNFAISAVEKRTNNQEADENYLNALRDLVVNICKKSSATKDRVANLVDKLLYSKNLVLDQKIRIFKALSQLDIFENELLLPVLVRNLIKKYNKTIDLPKDEFDELRMFVMVETLSDFISSREIEIPDGEEYIKPYFIEFLCENPNSLHTLPNKLLSLLDKRFIRTSNSASNKDGSLSKLSTENILKCLTAIRPLHENAEEDLTLVLNDLVKQNETRENKKSADMLQSICLVIQIISDLSCPKDFLGKIDLNLMNALNENIENTDVARALGTIFYHASLLQSYNQDTVISLSTMFGKGDENFDTIIKKIESKLISSLSTYSSIHRKYYLKSLMYLSDKNNKNYGMFDDMLKAENISPDVHTYRDRVKHLGDIAWTEDDENDMNEATSSNRFCGGLQFLFGNLSVNFTPLWDSTIKVIDSYLSSEKHFELSWSIVFEIIIQTKKKIETCKNENVEKQFLIYRNLIIKALTYSSTFIPFVEKKNQLVVNEFLSTVYPSTQKSVTPNIKTMEAYIELFKKFSNLRNISKFQDVKNVVIQHILGHSLATESSLKCAVEFFFAAYKSLKPHKDILLDLVDSKNWRTRFLSLSDETFQHSENDGILADLIYQLLSAKLKRTAKEKRTAQIANRKFIVRTMFQVGLERGLQFLRLFKRRELINIDRVLDGTASLLEKKIILRRLDITFDVFMLAAKNANCRKDIFDEIIELLVFQGKVVHKEIKDGGREGAGGKRRNKLLDNLIQVYLSLKGCDWSDQQKDLIVNDCISPLLFSDVDNSATSNTNDSILKQNSLESKKFHFLSKLPKLFQHWVDDINYHNWFFNEGNKRKDALPGRNKNVFQSWMCEKILASKAVDPEYKSKVFTVICHLIIASTEEDTMNEKERTLMVSLCKSDETLPLLVSEFRNWLSSKACMKRSRETLPRLKALQEIINYAAGDKTNIVFMIEKIASMATSSTLEVQKQCIHLLNVLFQNLKSLKQNDLSLTLPTSSFKLLCNISNYDNKKLMSQTLWNHVKSDNLEESNDIQFDDNFLHGNYKKLYKVSQDGKNQAISEQHFLFLFHFAAAEIYNEDFSQRSAAVLCLRDIIRHRKSSSQPECSENETTDFVNLVDKIMLPIISKGLQSMNDRIQAEFMGILQECIITDEVAMKSYLGSIQDVDQLMPSEGDDHETNFFENMIHIQKHRRGRAMRRLATKLDEKKSCLSRSCRLFLVYPLVRTYIYNESYISQPEIVNSAILCISSLAATYNWKDYKNLLLQFLVSKNQNVKDSPPFRKQRVKILSGILNSFHFPAGEESAIKLKDVIGKILQKIARAGSTGSSQDVEDQVDIALFVPILKIMLMFPDNWLKSNLSMLLINLASRLRSRKIEERTASRDVLCQITKLLGSNYFHFIFSILEGNLQRGYQLHILLFTINAIMNSMTEESENQAILATSNENVGAFDDSLDKIMDLIGNELFGNILEEKRVAALVKKTPEASKTISFGLLEKLGSYTSKGNISKILNSLLASNTTYKYITSSTSTSSYESLQKLRKAMKSFQTGLVKNKSFLKADYLLISHGLLSGKLLSLSEEPSKSKSNKALLQEIALNLLCHNASQPYSTSNDDSKYNEKAEDMKPFRLHITECINEKDVNVVTACLKYLSIITQNRTIVDLLLDKDFDNGKEDFMCTITKKCRHYQPMKNNQPYNFLCQILRNLLTHNTNYQFDNAEQLKSICLFFQMCLESNYDDVNAIKLLGLLLFKFYNEESSSTFLKLLCVCTIKCKDEMTFNMTKPIILKIVKKHRVLPTAMAFYTQHVTYEIVDGRRRSITICGYLLESLCSKSGNSNQISVPLYDTKGLFLASTTQLMNEQCCKTKDKLEELLKTIIHISRVRSKQDGKNSAVFDLIHEWCTGLSVLCRSIGFKLMTLYIPCELSDEYCRNISKPILEILIKALEYISETENGQPSQVNSFLLANILQMFQLMMEAGKNNPNETMKDVVDEFIFGNLFQNDHMNNLLVHENVSVRNQTLHLLRNVFQTRLNKLRSDGSSEPKPKKQKKIKKSIDKFAISAKILKSALNNICEMAKVDVKEEDLLVSNLVLIYDICEYDLTVEKANIKDTDDAENEYLTREYVHKKARSIFTHEKFHVSAETSRRVLFYKFILRILENITETPMKNIQHNQFTKGRTLPESIKSNILKHLMKDRKQSYLEEYILQIEKKIQDVEVI